MRRILERHVTVLILERRLRLGAHEVHDSLVLRRNRDLWRKGRLGEQSDPLAMTIEVQNAEVMPFADLPFTLIRAAGFRTTDEFHEDWMARRRAFADEVVVHRFRIVADARYLHAEVHRGYTTNPGLAAWGEPEALSTYDLEQLARRARKREMESQEFRQRAQRALALRAKGAVLRGDVAGMAQVQREIVALGMATAGTATV